MTLNPSNRMTIEEARQAGILTPALDVEIKRKSIQEKPEKRTRRKASPTLPSDGRRPWLDTILARFAFAGDVGPEDAISAELADRIALAELECRSRCIAHHVANEGKRSKGAGALAKYIGMFPGVADWFFMGASWGGGVIELKIDDGAVDPVRLLSPNQKTHRLWCLHHGVRHAVCTSADEAWETLIRWGAVVDA